MQLFNMKERWLVALTDEEVIAITAKLLHCKANNINATQEEKLKALNYFKDRIVKDNILENELKKVKEYERTDSSKMRSDEV